MVQQAEQRVDDSAAHARRTARQARRRQQHHGAHDIGRQRRADPGSMAANEVVLKLAQALGGNMNFAQAAEAGRNTVDDPLLSDDSLDQGA